MRKIRPIFWFITIIVIYTVSCTQSKTTIERRIARVEGGLLSSQGDPPWNGMELEERMDHYNVPGVSIAIINNFQVEWEKGYGVLEAGKSEPVTPQTLFQTASIAKPVVALAALHYIEMGVLTLDGDVNHSMVSWQLPENKFTSGDKVTLRRLLSHSAGVTVSGFRGYTKGEEIPNLQQILDGEPPANSLPIRVDTVPGTLYRYSGGGYMVVQKLLEDVTGMSFPEIMEDTVLKPLGMKNSTFESPLPEDRWSNAATGHRADGRAIPGRWHTYPEMGSGASMWGTPSDLARFAVVVMLAYTGKSEDTLSQEIAIQMLTPQLESRGLGPLVYDDGGDRFYFLHPGGNEGYRTYLVGYPLRGQGVVIMTNSDNGDALWQEILNSVSNEYGWVKDYTTLYMSITGVIGLTLIGILFTCRRRVKVQTHRKV
jgi:CubicO group peptidase (beta-lactamase class C family)